MAKVVNMKYYKPWEQWEPYNIIRIDRATLWGNPYIIGINGNRDTVCDLYSEWLNRWIKNKEEVKMQIGIRIFSNEWVIEHLEMLKGKDLACWCVPERCHGDTLLKLVLERA